MTTSNDSEWRFLGKGPNRCPFVDDVLTFPLHQVWRTQLDTMIHRQPVSDGEDLYVCSMSTCYRVDKNTGEIRWSQPALEASGFPMNVMKIAPAVYRDRVYCTDLSGRLYCFDKETGQLRWTKDKIGAFEVSPCIVKDRIYISSKDRMENWKRSFYCLDLEGNIHWKFSSDSNIKTIDGAVQEGILVITDDNNAYGLDSISGSIIWQHDFSDSPGKGTAGSFVMINGNTVLLPGGRALNGMDLYTGEIHWRHQARFVFDRKGQPCGIAALAATPDYLMYTTIDEVHVVDMKKGELVSVFNTSQHQLQDTVARIGLIVGQHYLVNYGQAEKIVAYNWQTGEADWMFKAQGQFFYNSAIYVSGQLFFGNVGGYLYCFAP